MSKIVYNSCFGGFSLSRRAVLRGREISGSVNWPGKVCLMGDVYEDGTICEHDYGYIDNLPRHDTTLVKVVEELGDAANGPFAELKIFELPSGSKYIIDEYDGFEAVKTPEDYEWIILP